MRELGSPPAGAGRSAAANAAYAPGHALLGAGLALAAGLCFSTGGLFVRAVTVDAWEIIFIRCLFAALAVLLLVVVRERRRAVTALRRGGWPALAAGLTTGWAIIAYVLAMQETLVANVIAIMTTSTVMVAILAHPLLGERVTPRTWLALIVSICGVGLMFWDAAGTGGLLGNLLAVSIAAAIAVQTLIARRYRGVPMEPAVIAGACAAGVVALPFALPLTASPQEIGLLAGFGIVQLACALTLYFHAARYLPAPTLIFVVLIDAILSPVWVWLGFSEVPTHFAFIGGGLVLASVTLNAMLGLRVSRRV